MTRTGLGRHSALADTGGDPLDGLVNLFDIGIVLAVAFLIAGLGLTLDARSGRLAERDAVPAGEQRTLPAPQATVTATGRGQAVGTLYRLQDGRLVVVGPGGQPQPVDP